MTDTLQRIIQLTVQGNQAIRELKKVNNSMDDFATKLNNVGRLAKTAFAAVGISLTGSFLRSVISTNAALSDQAELLGLNVETLQEYQYAARAGGVETTLFNESMLSFAKRVGELRNEMGPLFSALKNVDTQLLSNLKKSKNQEEAFRLIADAVANATNATEKAVITNAAFNRSGIKLNTMLKDGADGLDRMAERARELDLVVGQDLVNAAKRYDDQLLDLELRVKSTFGISFLTTLKAVSDHWQTFLVFLASGIDKAFLHIKATIQTDIAYIVRQIDYLFLQVTVPQRTILEFVAKITGSFDALAKVIPTAAKAEQKLDERLKEINASLAKEIAIIDKAVLETIIYNNEIIDLRDSIKSLTDQVNNTVDPIADLNKRMREYVDTIIKSAREFEIKKFFDDQAIIELTTALNIGAISVAGYAAEMKKLGVDLFKAEDFIQSFVDSAKQLDFENFLKDDAIARLKTELDKGNISLEAYNETVKKIKPEMEGFTIRTIDLSAALGDSLHSAIDGLADALIEFSKGGKDAFKNFANSVINDIARLIIKYNLLKIASSFIGGGGGGQTGAQSSTPYPGGKYASGGVVNNPTAFMSSSGLGLMGESGPEAILPLSRGSSGNLGVEASVNVNVKNYAAGVSVTAEKTSNGDIEIIVAQIADRIRTGGNKLSNSLENVYGMSRARGAY